VRSQQLITSATVFVPALEAQAYRDAGATNVVEVPDSVRGITATRNWILDNANDPWVVFLDDDVKSAGWRQMLATRAASIPITEQDFLAEAVKLFEVCEAVGYRVWGSATESSAQSVHPYRPFVWRGYVTASCMGIINRGLRFDERFKVKEDYEICLRCLKEDGGIVGARYWFWENDHWGADGGCKDYRTQLMERQAIKLLKDLYPGQVRAGNRKGCDWCIKLVV
jgi:hypothetical protein